MSSVLAVVLLAFAGFCFGGAYAFFSQKKPLWMVALLVMFGALSLAAGWLYL
jgi:hypothetical protein